MRVRRTPCVGVCSTTYGDLVCRGCKRFSHEIVGWNGYTDDQQARIWTRLNELRAQSVLAIIDVVDETAFEVAQQQVGSTQAMSRGGLILELLRTSTDLGAAGLSAKPELTGLSNEDLVRAVDREFYVRSNAHYERSFKVRSS